MRRRILDTFSIKHDDLPLDVILYNTNDGALYRTKRLWDKSSNEYQPVGIVVCPEACYDDGTCGVMALRFLVPNVPNWTEGYIGIRSNQFVVGPINSVFNNISRIGVRIYDGETLTENYRNVNSDGYTVKDPGGHMTIDIPMNEDNVYNDSQWITYPDRIYKTAPILIDDNTLNPDHVALLSPPYDTVNNQNALVDFDGKNKFNILYDKWGSSFMEGYDDPTILGQPKYAVITYASEVNNKLWVPAIFACRLYITPGTIAGDWYLPAIGECACLHNKTSRLYRTLDMVRDWTNYPILSTLENVSILSSTGSCNSYNTGSGGTGQKHYFVYGIDHANVSSLPANLHGGWDSMYAPNKPQKNMVIPFMRGQFERI